MAYAIHRVVITSGDGGFLYSPVVYESNVDTTHTHTPTHFFFLSLSLSLSIGVSLGIINHIQVYSTYMWDTQIPRDPQDGSVRQIIAVAEKFLDAVPEGDGPRCGVQR